ncbi:MAG: tRNA (N6-isopentenyl adenosine(37)-C2)-methylthiotransferase MiaB [Candidatus Omnitrophica bacterium]|nr:tRNA (N6-isopentenyl adenosine(37)-C2)-methylthiotransferase MiaB [Candidatus Omnitrophota bacterium]
MKEDKRKVFIKTMGCQMNVRDSEVICGLLKKAGYRITDNPAKADVLLFNTCSVRQHAEDKAWSEIGRYKTKDLSLSRKGNQANKKTIGLIGCMAQNYKEEAFRRMPQIDFVVGPSDIDKIPEIINKLPKDKFFKKKLWETGGKIRPEGIYHNSYREDKNHAYVVISEGCSNFCSYCVVPYVRGPLHNRNYKEIIKEVEEAVGKGITSVTLLGQNVNAYQDKDVSFIKLVSLVDSVKDLREFSFITSHPKDTTSALFKAMAESAKLKKNLHLPLQSGSDRILKAMNRQYSKRFYLDLADNYRRIIPKGLLSTDIIVGFPTETRADFEDTCDLVKEIEFDAAYIFKYSPRPHTQAQGLVEDVSKEEKESRHAIVLKLQKDISNKKKCKKR